MNFDTLWSDVNPYNDTSFCSATVLHSPFLLFSSANVCQLFLDFVLIASLFLKVIQRQKPLIHSMKKGESKQIYFFQCGLL